MSGIENKVYSITFVRGNDIYKRGWRYVGVNKTNEYNQVKSYRDGGTFQTLSSF